MGRKRLSKWYTVIFYFTILYEKTNLNYAAIFKFVMISSPSKIVSGSYIKEKTNGFVSSMLCGLTINKIRHMAIGLAIIMLLPSCQSARFQVLLKKPLYEADIMQIEQILYFVDQEKYQAALAENERLERRYEDSENVSYDYSRVIIKSARMNAILIKKVIQDQKNHLKRLQDIEQMNRMNKAMSSVKKSLNANIEQLNRMNKEMNSVKKSLNAKIDKLTNELTGMNTALKTIENLKAENRILQQQIEDFKKIDLQSEQNVNSTQ